MQMGMDRGCMRDWAGRAGVSLAHSWGVPGRRARGRERRRTLSSFVSRGRWVRLVGREADGGALSGCCCYYVIYMQPGDGECPSLPLALQTFCVGGFCVGGGAEAV